MEKMAARGSQTAFTADGWACAKALKAIGVVWMVLLAVVTFSLYLPYWVWRRGDELARLLRQPGRLLLATRAYALLHLTMMAVVLLMTDAHWPKAAVKVTQLIVAAAAVGTSLAFRQALLRLGEERNVVLPTLDRARTCQFPLFYIQAKLNEFIRLNRPLP